MIVQSHQRLINEYVGNMNLIKRVLLHLLVIAAPVAALCNPVEPYSADKHARGIKEILVQTVPSNSPFLSGTSYSYLVGNADYILGKLTTPQYTGYVACENGIVEGFICYHITEAKPQHPFIKEKCLYVDWIATRLGHQRKGLGTLFSAQIRNDANQHQLPVMLNTLTRNAAMQGWCTKHGLEYVGTEGILKYYRWRPKQEVNQPVMKRALPTPTLSSWIYTHRYKIGIITCITGVTLLAGYKYAFGGKIYAQTK